MTEPTLMIVGGQPKRRRGRPLGTVKMSTLSTWVPVSLHDRAIAVAGEHEKSLSELVKDALVIALPLLEKQRAG